MLGAHAIATPWSTTPLALDSSWSSIRYVANLAWGYHTVVDRWEAWLHAWPKDAGIPIVPTLYVDWIDEKTLIDAAAHFATADLIIKPQVAASSFNILRVLVGSSDFTSSAKSMNVTAAVDELIRLGIAHSAAMIQPFMSNVVREGELSVLMFDGQLSHAVRKIASPADYRVQSEYGGITSTVDQPSAEMLELAHASLAICPETPTYARVDMIRNHLTGRLNIMELELIEPDLFLRYAVDGGMAFARAILQVRSQN
ncbi:unnamed protein product [Rotaria sordida]|uniref:Uncharacterized protein n=1 Tax=Rotaria sordida TaxID=392033 RepID=A0A819BTD5_9BILA|nr:unnamed protein product [Rotaria sordida]CAF0908526.1 unnamed protein product [Rotaria sordida]CAF3807348.1 unnamed protein product [Rotaria sordida]CAF3887483.1 unnamed protein product [Rotaria sordida]